MSNQQKRRKTKLISTDATILVNRLHAVMRHVKVARNVSFATRADESIIEDLDFALNDLDCLIEELDSPRYK